MNIKLYKSPWRAIQLILLSSVFVGIGIFMLRVDDSPKWIAWFGIGFFGLGFPVALFHLFDRRPQIIINELGIFDRTAYRDFINWEVIYDAYPIDISGQKFVCLIVAPEYEPSTKKGKFARSMSDLSKAIGAQELNICLGQIRIDELRLTQFIKLMITLRPEQRKEKLDKKLLTSTAP